MFENTKKNNKRGRGWPIFFKKTSELFLKMIKKIAVQSNLYFLLKSEANL